MPTKPSPATSTGSASSAAPRRKRSAIESPQRTRPDERSDPGGRNTNNGQAAAERRPGAGVQSSDGPDRSARPYHHGNLREELIRFGKARLSDGGLSDLSLRRVAGDAGVSQVAPMHHFGNKEGLLAAIAASGFRDLTEFRYSRLRPTMTAEQRLRVLMTAYVQFATLNPALFNLMYSPQFTNLDLHTELIDAASQSYQLLVRGTTEYVKEATGTADASVADDAARLAWICMHGLATLLLEHRINPVGAPRYTREQLLSRTVDQVFAAIGKG